MFTRFLLCFVVLQVPVLIVALVLATLTGPPTEIDGERLFGRLVMFYLIAQMPLVIALLMYFGVHHVQ